MSMHVDKERPFSEARPDLLDRIFEIVIREFLGTALQPHDLARARSAVRAEFGGEEVYISKRDAYETAREVHRLFNGRNVAAVAHSLKISRRTVYRYLKQPIATPVQVECKVKEKSSVGSN